MTEKKTNYFDSPEGKAAMQRMEEMGRERKKRQREEPWDMPEPLRDWIAHGLHCVILDGPMGINGYVFVPLEHPFHLTAYSECPQGCEESWCDHTPESAIDVHGGITFSHLAKSGEWVFGFDTCHAGDFMITPISVYEGQIWDEDAVADETAGMAEQLAVMAAQD